MTQQRGYRLQLACSNDFTDWPIDIIITLDKGIVKNIVTAQLILDLSPWMRCIVIGTNGANIYIPYDHDECNGIEMPRYTEVGIKVYRGEWCYEVFNHYDGGDIAEYAMVSEV